MKRRYWITLTVFAALWTVVWFLQSGDARPADLASRALSSSQAAERTHAAAELGLLKDPQAVAHMRRVAGESQEPAVRLAALHGLLHCGDVPSAPLFLDALDSPDKSIREVGLLGVRKTIGIDPKEYRVDDPPETRKTAVVNLREIYTGMVARSSNPQAEEPRSMVSASSPVSASPASAGPSAPAAPPPASTASTVPAAGATSIHVETYPAVHQVTWMCRGLAGILLIAELAGAISLLMDRGMQFTAKQNARSKGPLTTEERIEKILAGMAAGVWSKVAMLVAGAVCIAAFLFAGELFQAVVRVEQKFDAVRQR